MVESSASAENPPLCVGKCVASINWSWYEIGVGMCGECINWSMYSEQKMCDYTKILMFVVFIAFKPLQFFLYNN